MHSLAPIYLFSAVAAGPKVTEHQYKFIYSAPSASSRDALVRFLCTIFCPPFFPFSLFQFSVTTQVLAFQSCINLVCRFCLASERRRARWGGAGRGRELTRTEADSLCHIHASRDSVAVAAAARREASLCISESHVLPSSPSAAKR